mgnify:CR=1 FL=1
MPRLYITWFADPEDPHYWKFFKVGGITVSLKSILLMPKWKLNRVLNEGFKKFFDYSGPLLIDSMLINIHTTRKVRDNVEVPQSFIMYLQHLLGSDLLIQKDYPLVGISDPVLRTKLYKKNLAMAEAALKYGDKVNKDVMLVVQGWDLNTYVECAEHYRNLGAKYIGIGSLVPHRSDSKFLVSVVKAVREVVGKAYIHLFGITALDSLTQLSKYVDSVDVSTPAIAASKKELIVWNEDRLIRVKSTTVTGMKIISELVENTKDELEKVFLTEIFKAKSLRDKNLKTMIYNAYILTKYWNAIFGN